VARTMSREKQVRVGSIVVEAKRNTHLHRREGKRLRVRGVLKSGTQGSDARLTAGSSLAITQ